VVVAVVIVVVIIVVIVVGVAAAVVMIIVVIAILETPPAALFLSALISFIFLLFPLPLPTTVEVWSVAYSPDGKLVASGSQKGNINIFNIQNLSAPVRTSLETKDKFIHSVAFVSSGGRSSST